MNVVERKKIGFAREGDIVKLKTINGVRYYFVSLVYSDYKLINLEGKSIFNDYDTLEELNNELLNSIDVEVLDVFSSDDYIISIVRKN